MTRRTDVGDHSGYTETGQTRISILENLLSENDRIAEDNGRRLDESGVRAVNLMSSPGAGKTTLLRKTLEEMGQSVRIGVLEGDIATSLDADQLEGAGAIAISVVNTERRLRWRVPPRRGHGPVRHGAPATARP